MEISCFTNLDDYDCYVTEVLFPPRVGDEMAVRYKGAERSLTVVSVKHTQSTVTKMPGVNIELHKRI